MADMDALMLAQCVPIKALKIEQARPAGDNMLSYRPIAGSAHARLSAVDAAYTPRGMRKMECLIMSPTRATSQGKAQLKWRARVEASNTTKRTDSSALLPRRAPVGLASSEEGDEMPAVQQTTPVMPASALLTVEGVALSGQLLSFPEPHHESLA